MSGESDPPPGLDALRRYEYVPRGSGGGIRPKTPVRREEPGTMRRYLPYVGLALGSAAVLAAGIGGLPAHEPARTGAWSAFAFSVILGFAGLWDLAKTHSARAYVPYVVAVLGAAVVLHVTIGGRHGTYPANVRADFLSGCEYGGGSPASCTCQLNWFESHKSLSEFNGILAEYRASGATAWDVRAAIDSCG